MKRFWTWTLGLACFWSLSTFTLADDPGYFLSWQQKKQLTCLGRIQDSAGTWYDVWICPGYAPPARYAKEHLIRAGGNFGEYFEANKYQMLRKGSAACFDWALKECGLGFTVKGIPRAWGKHFSVAHERTERRVFGWWLAYPWALMEASVETAFRGALGAAGTAGGIGSGLAIVPAWHALDSAVAGTWNLGVNTIALPAVGLAWNTAVAPPLALVGQKPAESRVDGFWVTVVDAGQAPSSRPLNTEEKELLAQWGVLLLQEARPFRQEQKEINRKAKEQEEEFYRAMRKAKEEAERERNRVQASEEKQLRQMAATNEWIAATAQQHPDLRYSWDCDDDVIRHLQKQGFSDEDIDRILKLLRTYQSPRAMAPPAAVRPKTDPVRRGAEVLGESAEDVIEETFK